MSRFERSLAILTALCFAVGLWFALLNSPADYQMGETVRLIDIYDETLKKNITIGNENIRSLATWRAELAQKGLRVPEADVQYIRLFPPFMFKNGNSAELLARENALWRRNPLLKEKIILVFMQRCRKGGKD